MGRYFVGFRGKKSAVRVHCKVPKIKLPCYYCEADIRTVAHRLNTRTVVHYVLFEAKEMGIVMINSVPLSKAPTEYTAKWTGESIFRETTLC